MTGNLKKGLPVVFFKKQNSVKFCDSLKISYICTRK